MRLPKDQWPQEWHDKGYVDPVCPLVLALYGHPDSGSDWEAHADKCVRSVGYAPVPNWPSCYWHADKQLFLVIYVDDFKLAGPMGNLEEGWQLLRSTGLKLDPPTPLGLYLGCKHEESERVLPGTNKTVRAVSYTHLRAHET